MTLTLTFCMCVGHDHSSHEIEGQGQRLRLESLIGSQFETRSVGLRSSIEDIFSSCGIKTSTSWTQCISWLFALEGSADGYRRRHAPFVFNAVCCQPAAKKPSRACQNFRWITHMRICQKLGGESSLASVPLPLSCSFWQSLMSDFISGTCTAGVYGYPG